jgi:deoxyribodipyrimidine photo-lyase
MPSPLSCGLVWFRRDLRAHDHPALLHALRECAQVHCVFVFDEDILARLPRADRRVRFIRESLCDLDQALRALSHDAHAGLIVLHACARTAVPELAQRLDVQAVYAGRDDEPAALERDAHVRTALAQQGRELRLFKDHTVFERSELLTQAGTPYTVFTPYKNAWLREISEYFLSPYAVPDGQGNLAPCPPWAQAGVPSLTAIGFGPSEELALKVPSGTSGGRALWQDFAARIDTYDRARNFPAVKGPSYLGVHLRFGTLSIRELARDAYERMQAGSPGAATWLSELIWRDFYQQLMAHFPHAMERSFKPAYDAIAWETGAQADALWTAWQTGQTGYPLVDAAMEQLNQTGYMHNRLRMVVASFLVKDLGLDWRRGEAYFAELLNDYELASNNGGWQWASSSGCDAQPWFRIFNPVTQSLKFDPQGRFIRRYLPQLAALSDKHIHAPWTAPPDALRTADVVLGGNYPLPIVDHAQARERTLARYAVVRDHTRDAT